MTNTAAEFMLKSDECGQETVCRKEKYNEF